MHWTRRPTFRITRTAAHEEQRLKQQQFTTIEFASGPQARGMAGIRQMDPATSGAGMHML
ncbi:MAG: hypothetical protein JNM66_22460 [Bryobacterales bacterium]|nr:hypothetical protein [Bryobacterales bacterium]